MHWTELDTASLAGTQVTATCVNSHFTTRHTLPHTGNPQTHTHMCTHTHTHTRTHGHTHTYSHTHTHTHVHTKRNMLTLIAKLPKGCSCLSHVGRVSHNATGADRSRTNIGGQECVCSTDVTSLYPGYTIVWPAHKHAYKLICSFAHLKACSFENLFI